MISDIKKQYLHCLSILLFASILTFCAVSQASALDQVTLQLKWTHQFQFAGYYAALQQGYYRDAGLDVTIKPATPGKDPVLDVIDGKAEYGVGTSSLLLMRNAGKPVVTLAVIFQHSPYILLTKESSANQTIHSLVGKRLMLEPQADELVAYLKKEGIPLEKMQMVEHSYNLKGLISGTVDAISGYITTDPDDLDRAGFAYNAYTPRSAGIDFYGDNIFTTESELKNHAARAKAFREASLKGWSYALQNPDEIIDLILRTYTPPGIRADRAHLKYEAEQVRQLIQPDLVEIGYMHSGRWQHIADTYKDLGLLPKNVDLRKFMYDPYPQKNLTMIYWIASSFMGFALLIIAARLIITSRNLKISEKQIREHYKEIQQINETLEGQVAERTADLNEAKLKSEQIINCAQEGVVVYDLDLRYRVWNPYMERLTGLTAAEVLGCHPLKFFPFMQESGMIERLENMLIDGVPVASDFPYFLPSTGVSGWSSNTSAPLRDAQGDIIGIIATVRDITEKRLNRLELLEKNQLLEDLNFVLKEQNDSVQLYAAEQAALLEQLRKSEELYHSMVETSLDLIYQCDAEGRYTYLNLAWEHILGYELQDILGKEFSDFQTPASAARSRLEFARLMKGESIEHHEATFIGKSGNEIHLVFNALYLFDEKEEIAGASGTAHDITVLKNSEKRLSEITNRVMEQSLELKRFNELLEERIYERTKELQASHSRINELSEKSHTVFWEVDAQGLYTYINYVSDLLFGYSPEEMIGRMHFYDLHPEPEREAFKQATFAAFERMEQLQHIENLVQTKDNRTIWITTNAIPMLGDDGTLLGYRGSDTDVTEHRKLKEQLLQSQKMEAVGQLAGGLAHDFNNALSIINGYCYLLQRDIEHDERLNGFMDKIQAASVRAGELTHSMLAFSRTQVMNPQNQNLN
jgi:PAS domain S-box-containing protein